MAIAIDATTVATFPDNEDTSLTFSHTCTGASLYLVVTIHSGFSVTSRSIASVTYNGVALSLVKDSGPSVDSQAQMYMYGLIAPATGAHNVVVTLATGVGGGRVGVVARTYTGVDQATPTGTAVSATAESGTATVNASSATGEVVVDGVYANNIATTLTVGAGQTQRSNDGTGDAARGKFATSDEPGAGTVTMSWTNSIGDDWATVAVSLKPGSVGGGFVPDEDFQFFVPSRLP